MITNNSELRVEGLCWSPKWFGRFESLWSLLRKFAFLNAASCKELRELLGRDHGKMWSSSQWKFAGRSDLRAFGGLDHFLFSRILRIDKDMLREATVLPFLREGEFEILASHYLRFCPSCIKANFHSSIYQVWLLKTCPIHGEPLTLRCNYCKRQKFPYTVESVPFASLLGCRNCVGPSNLTDQPHGTMMTHSSRE